MGQLKQFSRARPPGGLFIPGFSIRVNGSARRFALQALFLYTALGTPKFIALNFFVGGVPAIGYNLAEAFNKKKRSEIMSKILIFSSVIALGFSLALTGCAKQKAELDRAKAELASTKAALEKARSEQGDHKAKLDAVAQARDGLAKQVDDLTTARDRLQQTLTEVAGSRDKQKEELAEMTGERDRLQQQASGLSAARDPLQKQVEELTASRDAAAAEAKKAQKRIDELTAQLQAETGKVHDLQEQFAAVTQAKEGIETAKIEAIESPTIHSFTTTQPRISRGQNSTLSWRISNADRVRIEPDIGTVGTLGSRTIAPSKTTTYTLIATNKAGESRVTRRIDIL
jgi:predicted  nucleic acid-binding Zn-ribbon protein